MSNPLRPHESAFPVACCPLVNCTVLSSSIHFTFILKVTRIVNQLATSIESGSQRVSTTLGGRQCCYLLRYVWSVLLAIHSSLKFGLWKKFYGALGSHGDRCMRVNSAVIMTLIKRCNRGICFRSLVSMQRGKKTLHVQLQLNLLMFLQSRAKGKERVQFWDVI